MSDETRVLGTVLIDRLATEDGDVYRVTTEDGDVFRVVADPRPWRPASYGLMRRGGLALPDPNVVADPSPDPSPAPDQALLERVAELMLAWRDRHEPLEATARAIVAAVRREDG